MSIWWNKAALRATFFAWLAALEKMLIMNNLRKWHIIVVDWCCMCKKSGDIVDHFLLRCKIAITLCSSIFGLFGTEWVMPERVMDLLACWRG
jgi:hypothetical protein